MSRDPLDRYYTPPELAEACVRWLRTHWLRERLYDPCAGGGAWLDAARRVSPELEVGGRDIDPEAPAVLDGRAELGSLAEWRPSGKPCLVATNPPYGQVDDWIEILLDHLHAERVSGVALLMRLTAIEWLMDMDTRPDDLVVSSQRARWGGPGGAQYASGDSCGTVLAVWRPTTMHRSSSRIWPLGQWRQRGRSVR